MKVKKRLSWSQIFNHVLYIGDQQTYTQIIAVLSEFLMTKDLSEVTVADASNMVQDIYNLDKMSKEDLHTFCDFLFHFIDQYKQKIIRDVSLCKKGINVIFRVRTRCRYLINQSLENDTQDDVTLLCHSQIIKKFSIYLNKLKKVKDEQWRALNNAKFPLKISLINLNNTIK